MFDDDPEDAYDAADAPPVRLAVIRALVDAIAAEVVDPAHDHRRALTRISWGRFVLERLERDGHGDTVLADRLEALAYFEGA
jgi:hypothetical protein